MAKRVIIIGNDQEIRNILKFILKGTGFKTLSNPEPEDLSTLIDFSAHVILLDEFVNDEPGHSLYRKIKSIPALNDYLGKPFDLKVMADKVLRVVNHLPLPYCS